MIIMKNIKKMKKEEISKLYLPFFHYVFYEFLLF